MHKKVHNYLGIMNLINIAETILKAGVSGKTNPTLCYLLWELYVRTQVDI